MKRKLNQHLDKYDELLNNIQDIFANNGVLIYKKRNEIKNISFKGSSWTVKLFGTPNILNKIIYTFFRKSKAQRSFEYSMKIKSFVPEPLGYAEYFHFGLLTESYFISQEFKYDFTIREILFDDASTEKEAILKAFTKFSFDLHEEGIHHLDYSPGNILIKKEEESYTFKIVDINRMKFEPMELKSRAKNFSRIWLKDEDLKAIISEYCLLSGYNYEEMVKLALMFSRKHKEKANFKKRFKDRWNK